jgi:hypothetical protein
MQIKTVTLNSSQGPIERVVLQELGDILLVSRQEEVDAARQQHREPFAIGFRRADVIPMPVDGMELTKHNVQYESVGESEADSGSGRPR